jgi:hypothetical protein
MDCVDWMMANLILITVSPPLIAGGLIAVHENAVSNGDCSTCGDNFDPFKIGDAKICDPKNPDECQVRLPN